MKVLEGSFLFRLLNGNPAFLVKLEDGRVLLLNGDTLIERIGGEKIVGARHVNFLPDGTLVGMAMLEDSRAMPFREDTLLRRFREGKPGAEGSPP